MKEIGVLRSLKRSYDQFGTMYDSILQGIETGNIDGGIRAGAGLQKNLIVTLLVVSQVLCIVSTGGSADQICLASTGVIELG